MEATMKVGQRVRFKSTSDAARYWKIPHDAQGTVMCSYRLLANNRAAPDRLDVRFTPHLACIMQRFDRYAAQNAAVA